MSLEAGQLSNLGREAPLLRTKLLVPQTLTDLVSRPRIHGYLDRGLHRKLTLITATAGFGKTTAISEWLRRRDLKIAWVSLDPGDNDSFRFWSYVAAALAGLEPGAATELAALRRSAASRPSEASLSRLIDVLATISFDFSLVLDDYHVITEPLVHESLSFFLRYAPAHLHLILAGRTEPPLQLSRLRAAGQVVDLSEQDLGFILEETSAFYRQRHIELSRDELEKLAERTGGWAACMQLIAFSLQEGGDKTAVIGCLRGSDRHLSGYFMEEVFGGLPVGVQEFLLQTSLLGRLSGPLCDAVTGREDGGPTLAKAARQYGFLIGLDEAGGWYMYHQLFAEFLRDLLRSRHPAAISTLYLRAARWCQENGLSAEAVDYYLQGESYEQAVELIQDLAGPMLGRGETATLLRWLQNVPGRLLESRPRLALVLAWAAVSAGRMDEVERWLEIATVGHPANGYTGGEAPSHLNLDAAMLRMIVAVRRMDIPTGRYWLDLAAQSPGGVSLLAKGLAFSSLEPSLLGGLLGWSGNLKLIEQSIDNGGYRKLRHLVPAEAHRGYIPVLQGEARYEWNQLDAAVHVLAEGIEEAEGTADLGSLVPAFFTLAKIHVARGDLVSALAVANEAEKRARHLGRPEWLPVVAALRTRLNLLGGHNQAVDDWLAGCRLDVYDRPSAARAYEQVTLARVLLAQGRGEENLLFLERLLNFAEKQERLPNILEISNLLALAYHAVGRTKAGLQILEQNLRRGRKYGYFRLFVDEGAPLLALLKRFSLPAYRERLEDEASYLAQLATALRASPQPRFPGTARLTSAPLVDRLTDRELAVVRLLAAGLDNRSIAAELAIALTTLKSHLRNSYAKLGVSKRQEAVERAERLGLLR